MESIIHYFPNPALTNLEITLTENFRWPRHELNDYKWNWWKWQKVHHPSARQGQPVGTCPTGPPP